MSVLGVVHKVGWNMFLLGLVGLVVALVLIIPRPSKIGESSKGQPGLIALGSLLLVLFGAFLAFCIV